MAFVSDYIFGRLTAIEGADDEKTEFRKGFVDTEGLIVVCESEHKQPGKKFIRYFPYEEDMTQRYLTTSLCDIEETDFALKARTVNSVYTFVKESSLSKEEMTELILNVFVRI